MKASTVADWITVLRAAEKIRFSRVVPWDGQKLWYCEYLDIVGGRLHRDLIVEGENIRIKPDEDT